jgi:hypothetical protein
MMMCVSVVVLLVGMLAGIGIDIRQNFGVALVRLAGPSFEIRSWAP